MTALGQKLPYEERVLVLFTLVFASFVLVILVTFSSPFIPSISFLRLSSEEGRTGFGVFGWCDPASCAPYKAAYEWTVPYINGSLTGPMLLWPIAAAFTLFAVFAIIPLLLFREGIAGNKPLFMIAMGGSLLSSLVGWLLSVFGWSVARRSFTIEDQNSELGPAIWMGLCLLVCMAGAWVIGWPLGTDKVTAAPRWKQSTESTQVGPPVPPDKGYFHYKRTTREYLPATRAQA